MNRNLANELAKRLEQRNKSLNKKRYNIQVKYNEKHGKTLDSEASKAIETLELNNHNVNVTEYGISATNNDVETKPTKVAHASKVKEFSKIKRLMAAGILAASIFTLASCASNSTSNQISDSVRNAAGKAAIEQTVDAAEFKKNTYFSIAGNNDTPILFKVSKDNAKKISVIRKTQKNVENRVLPIETVTIVDGETKTKQQAFFFQKDSSKPEDQDDLFVLYEFNGKNYLLNLSYETNNKGDYALKKVLSVSAITARDFDKTNSIIDGWTKGELPFITFEGNPEVAPAETTPTDIN